MNNHNKVYRVRASVYSTPHNKIRLSSGRVPLYNCNNYINFINLSISGFNWGGHR